MDLAYNIYCINLPFIGLDKHGDSKCEFKYHPRKASAHVVIGQSSSVVFLEDIHRSIYGSVCQPSLDQPAFLSALS